MERRNPPRSIAACLPSLALSSTLLACDPVDEGRPVLDDDGLVIPVADPRGGDGQGIVTPVLFIPAGESVSAEQVALVQSALLDVFGWYDDELDDMHVRSGVLEIVYGQHDAATYRGDDGIWSLGPDELRNALGYSPWDSGHIVLLVGAGLEGWAGGGGNGNAGFAVVGLESLANTSRCEPLWWCTPQMWRGTAIHELGHALTLPHSIDPSIMSFHGDWQERTLLDDPDYPEFTTVRALPFAGFDYGPVAPDPDPAPEPEPEPEPQPEPSGGCGDVDYYGYCDGGTLVWCENAALRSFDCANVGMTCGWQDDAVGNNCL